VCGRVNNDRSDLILFPPSAVSPDLGDKKSEGRFSFLTRPLRPSLNSQSVYPDYADRQQLCWIFFRSGCLQQREHIIKRNANRNSFLSLSAKFFQSLPLLNSQRTVSNYTDLKLCRKGFLKIFSKRFSPFSAAAAFTASHSSKNKAADNILKQKARKGFLKYFCVLFQSGLRKAVQPQKGQAHQRDWFDHFSQNRRI
jgi:hypothetical protein